MNLAGCVTNICLLVVIHANVKLPERGIDRGDRVDAMPAEIVRGVVEMILRMLERPNRRLDLGMRLVRGDDDRGEGHDRRRRRGAARSNKTHESQRCESCPDHALSPGCVSDVLRTTEPTFELPLR